MALTSSLRLPNGQILPNRIAKAAMTEALADANDHATERHVRLYRRWSEGGAGLLITGNVMVDARFLERPRNVVIEDDAGIDRLRAWAEAGRVAGNHLFMQLSHPGRQTQRFVHAEPVAPSAVPAVAVMKSFARPRALHADEIPPIVLRFARAAEIAERAGFTGVQIHAAHGYLISQFLSPLTNLRTDEWGGSLENRARFLLETVRAVRARVSPSFCVSVKLNSADFQRGGFAEEDSICVAVMLEKEGIDLLEISGGNYESPALFGIARSDSTRRREAYFVEFSQKLRAATKVPVMVTGGFRSRAAMVDALRDDALDVVGLARPLALEPELPRGFFSGASQVSSATPKRSAVRSIGVLTEGMWYWMQLRRLADGLEPDPSLGLIRAAMVYVITDFTNAMLRKFRTRAPALPAPAAPRLLDR